MIYTGSWRWKLKFFRRERGDQPVLEFLKALLKPARTAAGAALAGLEENGPSLRRPRADYLRDGIYELRFSSERMAYRILYFFDGSEIVLTNAFVKKTWKVPTEEIERALRRRARWQAR
ncbi:MAG: type II toxin-antitoxin system RelE/ParE family toxin [Elusimicrobia bacterium]|nr:type II toxin-antitoxin system RelE/ParE family toxin [Elusimicrobiota bacterium]